MRSCPPVSCKLLCSPRAVSSSWSTGHQPAGLGHSGPCWSCCSLQAPLREEELCGSSLMVTRASGHKEGNSSSGDTLSIYQHGCSSLPVGYFTFCFCLLLGPAAAALQQRSCREVLPATATPKARAPGAAASSSPWQPLGYLCTGQGRSCLNLASAFRWVNAPDAHLYPPSCQAASRELGPFIFSLITDFSSISSWVNTNVAERLASL